MWKLSNGETVLTPFRGGTSQPFVIKPKGTKWQGLPGAVVTRGRGMIYFSTSLDITGRGRSGSARSEDLNLTREYLVFALSRCTNSVDARAPRVKFTQGLVVVRLKIMVKCRHK